jgi:hypothetical protein
VVRNNRIAASQADELVDYQLGVQGKALLGESMEKLGIRNELR